jgi:predicted RNA binding protein YcfA (HicA-like mRNA interferase family)
MNDRVRFADLRALLLDLGFSEKHVPGSHYYFEHTPSKLTFLFPECGPEDVMHPAYVVTTRMQLDAKGLMDCAEFDRRWRKVSA